MKLGEVSLFLGKTENYLHMMKHGNKDKYEFIFSLHHNKMTSILIYSDIVYSIYSLASTVFYFLEDSSIETRKYFFEKLNKKKRPVDIYMSQMRNKIFRDLTDALSIGFNQIAEVLEIILLAEQLKYDYKEYIY